MTRRVLEDAEAVAVAACGWVGAIAEAAQHARGRFTLAVSGGTTPRLLFERLARADLPWEAFHVAWVDERDVSADHPESNAGMAYRAWLDHVPIPRSQIHPVPTRPGPPEAARRAYEASLRRLFGPVRWPTFDLVLLGVGADGHTASLFPGSQALEEAEAWVVAPYVQALESHRFSLSLPVLAHARHMGFLVTGADKADIVQALFEGPPIELPARRVADAHGHPTWLLDAAAASRL